jgi:hypothetical protein
MSKSIIHLVDELPNDNMTVKVLKALDTVVPGKWNNLVGFDNTIRAITGETKPKTIDKIRERAESLYNDPKQSYQSVVKLYQTIDKADIAMGTAALANKIGEQINFFSFLKNITPKADVTQSIDLLLKTTVEIIAFSKLNNISQPNPKEFVNSLTSYYQDSSLMRMGALVCLDGVLPLGPDFIAKIQNLATGSNPSLIAQNQVFSAVQNFIPGTNTSDKLGFMFQGFNLTQGWMSNFISKSGITRQSILNNLRNFIQIADNNLDFVSAFLDQTTNYYEHTGIQTVARSLILQSYAGVKKH